LERRIVLSLRQFIYQAGYDPGIYGEPSGPQCETSPA
jgi:hypothetical protein